jgi:dTDP-4-amino-4,6-dideoxygalactose transaminase
MNVPLIDLVAQYRTLKPEIDEAVGRVLESGKFILGGEVEAFESDLASYAGVSHCIGVNSCTDGLLLGLRALGVGPGDEVITTPFTFVSTAETIALLGAEPVMVDVERQGLNIDVDGIEGRVTQRTKAILPVHLYGQSADMDPIMEIASRHGIKVFEDAAQAIGATYRGKKVCALGHLAALSFFPTKNLSCCGDGGAILTDDEELAQSIRPLRVHGASRKYHHDRLGYNSRLDAIQAAVLRVKLRRIDAWNERRRKIAARYTEQFDGFVETPVVMDGCTHVYHQYTIRTDRRDELREHLKQAGVATAVHYPMPLHLQPAFQYLGYAEGDFPVAEEMSARVLSLPVYPELTDDQVEYVADTVKSFFEKR